MFSCHRTNSSSRLRRGRRCRECSPFRYIYAGSTVDQRYYKNLQGRSWSPDPLRVKGQIRRIRRVGTDIRMPTAIRSTASIPRDFWRPIPTPGATEDGIGSTSTSTGMPEAGFRVAVVEAGVGSPRGLLAGPIPAGSVRPSRTSERMLRRSRAVRSPTAQNSTSSRLTSTTRLCKR